MQHDVELAPFFLDRVEYCLRLSRLLQRRNPSAAELAAAVNRSNEIQEALWQQAKAVAVRDTALVPTGFSSR